MNTILINFHSILSSTNFKKNKIKQFEKIEENMINNFYFSKKIEKKKEISWYSKRINYNIVNNYLFFIFIFYFNFFFFFFYFFRLTTQIFFILVCILF
jgi:hypothetical protein